METKCPECFRLKIGIAKLASEMEDLKAHASFLEETNETLAEDLAEAIADDMGSL